MAEQEAGRGERDDEGLADLLERFVEVDRTGERFGWMTAGYDLTCREAMLKAAERLRRGHDGGG